MPPPSDIVKVAVEWPGANAQLLEIDQVRPGNQVGGGKCTTTLVLECGKHRNGQYSFLVERNVATKDSFFLF